MSALPIRNAATIITVRKDRENPRVLVGQRGAHAAFMPNKYVFPGGAIDENDQNISLLEPLPELETERLRKQSNCTPPALAAAAIRELWEETGQILGAPAQWPDPPRGWRGFAKTGHRPSARHLRFVFRAITPKGGARRFDARFFLLDAEHLSSDPDDFSRAEDELSHLHWAPLSEIRALDLPFITQIVLAEVQKLITQDGPAPSVPFFHNADDVHRVYRL